LKIGIEICFISIFFLNSAMYNNNDCGWWYCRQRLWWLDWRRNRQWNRYFNYYNVNRVLGVEVCLEIFSAVSRQSVLIVGRNRCIREKNRPSSESTGRSVASHSQNLSHKCLSNTSRTMRGNRTHNLSVTFSCKRHINTLFTLLNSLISITSLLYIQYSRYIKTTKIM